MQSCKLNKLPESRAIRKLINRRRGWSKGWRGYWNLLSEKTWKLRWSFCLLNTLCDNQHGSWRFFLIVAAKKPLTNICRMKASTSILISVTSALCKRHFVLFNVFRFLAHVQFMTIVLCKFSSISQRNGGKFIEKDRAIK